MRRGEVGQGCSDDEADETEHVEHQVRPANLDVAAAAATDAEHDPERHPDSTGDDSGHVSLDRRSEAVGHRLTQDPDHDEAQRNHRDDHRGSPSGEQEFAVGLMADDEHDRTDRERPSLPTGHRRSWGRGRRPGDGEHLGGGGDRAQQPTDDEEVQRHPPAGARDHAEDRRHREPGRDNEPTSGLGVHLSDAPGRTATGG